MEYLVTTSGPMLLLYLKESIGTKMTIAHAATLHILMMLFYHCSLETTTIVNQATQQTHFNGIIYIAETLSGMASSAKASVAAMEKSPPWFSVELSNPTTDDIEVRICSGEDNRVEALVQLLEIYIQ